MRGNRIGGGRVQFLVIAPNQGRYFRSLPLADLHMIDAAMDGREIIMEFSDVTVVAAGRNLLAVYGGINAGWVASIEAFDPARRDRPADEAAPFIESFRFYTRAAPERQERAASSPRLVKPS